MHLFAWYSAIHTNRIAFTNKCMLNNGTPLSLIVFDNIFKKSFFIYKFSTKKRKNRKIYRGAALLIIYTKATQPTWMVWATVQIWLHKLLSLCCILIASSHINTKLTIKMATACMFHGYLWSPTLSKMVLSYQFASGHLICQRKKLNKALL